MKEQEKQIEKIRGRLRRNDAFVLFSSKADCAELMKFCNIIADKVDEIIEVINGRVKNG